MGRPHALLQASADAPLANWFARLSDVAPDGRVTQITGAGLSGAQRESMSNPQAMDPGKSLPAGHRDAPDDLGVSEGTSHPALGFECLVAHGAVHALQHDDFAADWREPWFTAGAAGCSGCTVKRRRTFRRRSPQRNEAILKSFGFPWPGEWLVTRDEGRQKTSVLWKGKMGAQYPWGKETDLEKLTYEIEDAHPEVNVIQGEAETTLNLKIGCWCGAGIFLSQRRQKLLL